MLIRANYYKIPFIYTSKTPYTNGDYVNLLNTVSEWLCEFQEHDCIHAAKQC